MNEITKQLNLIQTRLVAPKSQTNTFGHYKYRSCEDILEALKPLLEETKTTIYINDEVVLIGERYYVKATATLSDGTDKVSVSAFARESENRKGMDESQITGATSSYARKYALNGLFCIDDNKDADSTNNHNGNKKEVQKDEKTMLYEEVLATLKKKFSSLEKKKEWFAKKNIQKPIKELNQDGLSNLLDLLNDEPDL